MMSSTYSRNNITLTKTLDFLQQQLPEITFVSDCTFRWDPANSRLHYIETNELEEGLMMLLHEAGHALANHTYFKNDLDLLIKEVEAWSKARSVAKTLGVTIDEDTVENCLDSYRHWLDKRSTCPDCTATGYQDKDNCYQCFNCTSRWWVGTNQSTRVCRITAKA